MIHPLTERAKRSLTMAQEEGRRIHAPDLGSELLLLGLLRENEGIAAKILREMGLSANTVRADLAREYLAREYLAREYLAREYLAREYLAREPLVREDLARLGRGHATPVRDELPHQAGHVWFGEGERLEPIAREIPPSLHLKLALEMVEEEARYIYVTPQRSYLGTEHLLLGLLLEKDGLPSTIWRRLGLSSEAAQLQVLDYLPLRERSENKE